MRLRPLIRLLVGVMIFVTGASLLWLSGQWPAQQTPARSRNARAPFFVSNAPRTTSSSPFQLLSATGPPNSLPAASSATQHATRTTNPLALRLSNTPATFGQLLRRPTAILLENALLDTADPAALSIPDHLRAHDDPGAYVVQSRAPLDDAFRTRLRVAGASVVAYIPNQAYLVRASQAVAQQLRADPQTQAVLAYEPR